MGSRRWASAMRHELKLAGLIPARSGLDRLQRVGPEPVAAGATPEEIQRDAAEYRQAARGKTEQAHGDRIAKPVLELAIEARNDEKQNHPPTAPVAVMQPLDRGGEIDPEKQRRSGHMEEKRGRIGRRQRAKRGGIDDAENVVDVEIDRERAAAAETDGAGDRQHPQKDHPGQDDQRRQPVFGAVDAALDTEEIPDEVHRALRTARARLAIRILVAEDAAWFEINPAATR